MKLFDKKGGQVSQDSGDWVGFLDKGVKLDGRLELSGAFRLDSSVKGTIVSNSTLMLGENARVEGEIQGNQVVVAGRFEGTLTAKGRVEIQAKGVVRGEIHSPCLMIEAGGIFDGRCHMTGKAEGEEPVEIPIRAAATSQA